MFDKVGKFIVPVGSILLHLFKHHGLGSEY
jgi:hypothetical protein